MLYAVRFLEANLPQGAAPRVPRAAVLALALARRHSRVRQLT